MLTPWKESYNQPRQHIKRPRHCFANKGPPSQGYGFSSGHVWMWELDYKESWAPKNWCFWTVMLEKILESPLDCKEIQPVNTKGNQSWIFIGRTNAEAETPVLWPPDVKNQLIGKDPNAGKAWRQEEKGTTEDKMAGWHHRLDGHGFGWTRGVSDGQGGLECCDSWGHKESDMTEQLNWTDRVKNWNEKVLASQLCVTLCDLFAHQVPQSTEFSRQEYWRGLLFPTPGDLPNPGIKPRSSALQANSLPPEPPGKPRELQIKFWKRELNQM